MICLQDVSMSELQSNAEYTIKFTKKDISKLQKFSSAFGCETLGETLNSILFPQMGFNEDPFTLAKKVVTVISSGVDILEKTKRVDVVTYRIIVAEYLRNKGFTLKKIGKLLDKDHSTIIYYLSTAKTAIMHPKIYKTLHEKRNAFYTVLLQFQKRIDKI